MYAEHSPPRCIAPTARALALALLLSPVSCTLAAQSVFDSIDTSRGRCAKWTMPVGGSNFPQDAAYSRCALDRAPVLLPNAPMPAAPRFAGGAGASYRLIVNRDGTVDSARSRSMTITIGSAFGNFAFDFADQALPTLHRWRFRPAVRAGRAVRSAVDLAIVTDQRAVDTLPAHLEWRHVRGEDGDSLVGHWVTDPPLPSFSPSQEDSAWVALVRQLARMHVVLPNATRRYCLAFADSADDRDAASAARLARLAHVLAAHIDAVPANACVDTVDRVRLLLPLVQRVEDGGAVFQMAGAQLPFWPFHFETRAWARWRARCAGIVRDDAPASMECDVTPDVPSGELTEWYLRQPRDGRRAPPRRPTRDDEPVTLTVLARMSNAYGIDTLRATVMQVPSLSERAVRDAGPLCNRYSAWAPGDSGIFVLYGDLGDQSLRVARTNARVAPQEAPDPTCAALTDREPTLAAFMLGGVGTRAREPVTLCVGSCARRYVLDPERHMLAERPHLSFSIASLTEQPQRERDNLELRILVDPVPEGLVPLVIIDDPRAWAPAAWVMYDLGGGVWDWRVHYTDAWTRARRVLVYLVRK